MLNVGIVGIGNCGNQVAALANETLGVPVFVMNSSAKDLETIPSHIPSVVIGDKNNAQGAGKDRELAKKLLTINIQSILMGDEFHAFMDPLDVVFIVSSTGGGTGSGTAPLVTNIIETVFPKKIPIIIGVFPLEKEGLSAHVNTVEYLDEIKNNIRKIPYMLYDNNKMAGERSTKVLTTINQEIVSDIDVIRCTYNYTTRFNSIDDRDMTRIITFPGRLFVARVENFKEKDTDSISIEDMIIHTVKTNKHVELQRDKKVLSTGIITNLSEKLNAEFDDNIPKVLEFTGEPKHTFIHTYVNSERSQPNNVYLILSGLSRPEDRYNKIKDRIEEILAEQESALQDDDVLDGLDITSLHNLVSDGEKKAESNVGETDIMKIFNKFGINEKL